MRKVLNIHDVNEISLDKIEIPAPGPKDVLIDVKACGVCGSDLTYIKIGGIMRPPGGVTPIGHEAAGEVTFVGGEVEGITIGQRVAINPMMTPSNIGSGGPEGAFTDKLLVGEARIGENLFPIPDDIPYDIAALTEPLAVALHGVNRTAAKPGDKIVVYGCGPIGLAMILWLVDRGITDIVALDLSEGRLALARKMGARATLNPTKVDVKAELIKLHGEGQVLNRLAAGSDVYMDAAGAPNILSDVISMAKFHSRLVITAAYLRPVEMPIGAFLTTEMTITSAMGYPTEIPDVVASLPRLRRKLELLISHHYPLGEIVEAIKVAGTPNSAKVMIDINQG